MKRHPHILPRLCALFTLLFAAFRLTAAPVMPTLSTGSEEHWYYISFYNNGTINDKLLGYAGTANGNLTTVAAVMSQANQWKIIKAEDVDGTTYYKLVNRASGLYLGYKAARYRAVESNSSEVVEFKLTAGTNGHGYTLQRNNTEAVSKNWTLDASSGNFTTAGIEITDRPDVNRELVFLPTLPASDFKYILFAGYGRFGLHATNSSTLEVAAVTGSEAAGGGYKWGTVPVAGGYIYQSDNGYYLKQDGTTGWTVTTVDTLATVLTPSQNTYSQAVTRYNLQDAGGHALSFNGTALTAGTPNTRYSLINFSTTLNCP